MINDKDQILSKFVEKAEMSLYEQQLDNIKILGKYGWSLYYSDIIKPYINEQAMSFYPQGTKEAIENNRITISDVDKDISNTIKKLFLEKIKYAILQRNVYDKIKLENLFDDYKNNKYYECATILFGLIDAEIIKINLLDYKIGKYNIYQDNNGKYKQQFNLCDKITGKPAIKQGWDGFSITFKNNFISFFNQDFFKTHKEKHEENGIIINWNKERLFDDFVNNVKDNMDKVIGCEFLSIAYPLLIFFNDNDWIDYPSKPEIINRNWLMHGMYKYNDITESDCIKLILFYYQFTKFLDKYIEIV